MESDLNGWIDVGAADELATRPLQQVMLGRKRIALVFKDGAFSAISGVCNHVGGPLGEGTLDGDYVVCPWHYWKFHCRTGAGEPGYEDGPRALARVSVEAGRVLVDRRRARRADTCRIRRIRWRARRSASRVRSACSGFRPRR